MRRYFILLLLIVFAGFSLYSFENQTAKENSGANIETLEYRFDPYLINGDCLAYCEPLDPEEDPYWDITWGLRAGDCRDMSLITYEFYNFMYRTYLAYSLQPIFELPEGTEILEIRIRLFLLGHYGHRNNYEPITFPYWDGYGQNEHDCILSHVLLGDSLGVEDWSAGDPGDSNTLQSNLGTVVSANLAYPGYDPYQADYHGYYYMNVTNAIMEDIADGRIESHFRVAFMGMGSDYDSQLDYLSFSPCGYPPWRYPYLEVDYILPEEERAVRNGDVIQTEICISPNPVGNFANVEYLLPGVRSWQKYGLYNIKGQKLGEGELNGERGSLQLNLSNYPSGSYLIRIGDDYGRFIKVR